MVSLAPQQQRSGASLAEALQRVDDCLKLQGTVSSVPVRTPNIAGAFSSGGLPDASPAAPHALLSLTPDRVQTAMGDASVYEHAADGTVACSCAHDQATSLDALLVQPAFPWEFRGTLSLHNVYDHVIDAMEVSPDTSRCMATDREQRRRSRAGRNSQGDALGAAAPRATSDDAPARSQDEGTSEATKGQADGPEGPHPRTLRQRIADIQLPFSIQWDESKRLSNNSEAAADSVSGSQAYTQVDRVRFAYFLRHVSLSTSSLSASTKRPSVSDQSTNSLSRPSSHSGEAASMYPWDLLGEVDLPVGLLTEKIRNFLKKRKELVGEAMDDSGTFFLDVARSSNKVFVRLNFEVEHDSSGHALCFLKDMLIELPLADPRPHFLAYQRPSVTLQTLGTKSTEAIERMLYVERHSVEVMAQPSTSPTEEVAGEGPLRSWIRIAKTRIGPFQTTDDVIDHLHGEYHLLTAYSLQDFCVRPVRGRRRVDDRDQGAGSSVPGTQRGVAAAGHGAANSVVAHTAAPPPPQPASPRRDPRSEHVSSEWLRDIVERGGPPSRSSTNASSGSSGSAASAPAVPRPLSGLSRTGDEGSAVSTPNMQKRRPPHMQSLSLIMTQTDEAGGDERLLRATRRRGRRRTTGALPDVEAVSSSGNDSSGPETVLQQESASALSLSSISTDAAASAMNSEHELDDGAAARARPDGSPGSPSGRPSPLGTTDDTEDLERPLSPMRDEDGERSRARTFGFDFHLYARRNVDVIERAPMSPVSDDAPVEPLSLPGRASAWKAPLLPLGHAFVTGEELDALFAEKERPLELTVTTQRDLSRGHWSAFQEAADGLQVTGCMDTDCLSTMAYLNKVVEGGKLTFQYTFEREWRGIPDTASAEEWWMLTSVLTKIRLK